MRIKDPADLARRLYDARITQRGLAEVAGWSSATYAWKVLNGQAAAISDASAARIAQALNRPVDELFGPNPTRRRTTRS